MAINVYQIQGQDLNEDGISDDPKISLTKKFRIEGAVNSAQARNALVANTPGVNAGLPVFGRRVHELANALWEGEVQYSSTESSPGGDPNKRRRTLHPGQWRISSSSGTKSVHVTHGKKVVHQPADKGGAGNLAADFGGAISVDMSEPDRPKVEGMDVLVPTLQFSVSFGTIAGLLDTPFWTHAKKFVGTMNNSEFFGFERGNLLMQGFSTEVDSKAIFDNPSQGAEVSFEFEHSETLRKHVVAHGIPEIEEILGWDILTVTTVPAGTTGVAATSPVVVQADVIRVYEFTDFNSLFGLFN